MEVLERRSNVVFIDVGNENAEPQFADVFHLLMNQFAGSYKDIVLLCIGTDRATGDSLGPLIGYKLDKFLQLDNECSFSRVHIYGTLDIPVHAKNISRSVEHIACVHENPLIIAIDASLGKPEHVGCLTVGLGAIRPGAGLNKKLPHVGDIFITGIVNRTGAMDLTILQNTRLGIVMRLADVAAGGIIDSLKKLCAAAL